MTLEQIVAALVIVLRVRGYHGRPPVMPPRVVGNVSVVVEAARAVDPRPEFVRLVLAVCVAESGLQLRQRHASLCGCQPYDTDNVTQARCAARSVATSLGRCRTNDRVANRYVWGRCAAPTRASASVDWPTVARRYRARLRRVVRALSPSL